MSPQWQHAFNLLTAALFTILAVRLLAIRAGLKWFFVSRVLSAVVYVAADILTVGSAAYCALFNVLQPVSMLLSCLMTFEVFREALEQQPGLIYLARRTFFLSAVLGTGLAVILVRLTTPRAECFRCWQFDLAEMNRGVVLASACTVLLVAWRISRIPSVSLSRNVLVHGSLYVLGVLNSIAVDLYVLFFHSRETILRANSWLSYFCCASAVVWIIGLRRSHYAAHIRLREHKSIRSEVAGFLFLLDDLDSAIRARAARIAHLRERA